MLVSIKILPADLEVDLVKLKDDIQSALPEEVKVAGSTVEPIAFGLNALILQVILPEDRGGDLERLEEAIRETNGVGETETLMVSRA